MSSCLWAGCKSQNDNGRSFYKPHGNSEFVLYQDVLTVLEVVRVNYQTLCENVGVADTCNDGENAKVEVILVGN